MSAPPSGDPTDFVSLVGVFNFNYCQVGTANIGRVVNTNWIIQATVEITVIGVGPWASGDYIFNPHTPILVGCSSYPAGNQVYSYSKVPRSGKWIREDPLMAEPLRDSTPHRNQPFEEGVGACSLIEGATIFETADWFSPSPDTGKNVKIRFNKPDGAPLQRLKIFTGDTGPDGRPSTQLRLIFLGLAAHYGLSSNNVRRPDGFPSAAPLWMVLRSSMRQSSRTRVVPQ